jgi:exodeoxyribonuclease VII large subunit
MPVISAVGHETDFTIADFIADLRAATPTAAAQSVSPDRSELIQQLKQSQQRLSRTFERCLERRTQHLDLLEHRLIHPIERIARGLAHVEHLATRMRAAWAHQSAAWRWRLREDRHQLDAIKPKFEALASREQVLSQRLTRAAAQRLVRWTSVVKSYGTQLDQLNPHAVLARGYSIVESAKGEVVRDSAQVHCNETVRITFAQGKAAAQIIESEPDS